MPVQLQNHNESNAKLFSTSKDKKLHTAASLQQSQKNKLRVRRNDSASRQSLDYVMKKMFEDPTNATYTRNQDDSDEDNNDAMLSAKSEGGGSLRRCFASEGNLPGRMSASDRVSCVRRSNVATPAMQPIRRPRPQIMRQKSNSESDLSGMKRSALKYKHKHQQSSLSPPKQRAGSSIIGGGLLSLGGGSGHSAAKKKKSKSPMRRTISTPTSVSSSAFGGSAFGGSTMGHVISFDEVVAAPVIRNGKSA